MSQITTVRLVDNRSVETDSNANHPSSDEEEKEKSKRRVWLTFGRFSKCPVCQYRLTEGHVAYVPIRGKSSIRCELSACYKCNEFFSSQIKNMKDLEKMKPARSEFELMCVYENTINSYRSDATYKELKTKYCQIVLTTENELQIITIVTNKTEENVEKGIYHYSSSLALELLTAEVLHNQTILLDGIEYVIQRCDYYVNGAMSVRPVRPHDRVVVEKRKNGGYFDSDRNITLVDGLVFCERSLHLEILPMSFDNDSGVYFVDPHIYNSFLIVNGYPIVRYIAQNGSYYSDLRDESLLHQLGYNVSQRDALTSEERQEMLGRFVDLGFVSIASIQNLLWSLIARNGARNPVCRAKWESDSNFLSTYKQNHDRFVFVQNIREKAKQ